LQVSTERSFTRGLVRDQEITTSGGLETWNETLPEGPVYFWRVLASDPSRCSTESSEIRAFVVDRASDCEHFVPVDTGLSIPRRWPTITVLPDGRALVAGGDRSGPRVEADIWDPARGTWLPAAPMSDARDQHTATALRDGRVLVAGGETGNG